MSIDLPSARYQMSFHATQFCGSRFELVQWGVGILRHSKAPTDIGGPPSLSGWSGIGGYLHPSAYSFQSRHRSDTLSRVVEDRDS